MNANKKFQASACVFESRNIFGFMFTTNTPARRFTIFSNAERASGGVCVHIFLVSSEWTWKIFLHFDMLAVNDRGLASRNTRSSWKSDNAVSIGLYARWPELCWQGIIQTSSLGDHLQNSLKSSTPKTFSSRAALAVATNAEASIFGGVCLVNSIMILVRLLSERKERKNIADTKLVVFCIQDSWRKYSCMFFFLLHRRLSRNVRTAFSKLKYFVAEKLASKAYKILRYTASAR